MKLTELLSGIENCSCGRTHPCPIKHVIIEDGAIGRLSEIADGYKNILIIADNNTYRAAGKRVASALGDRVYDTLIFPDKLLVPNECAIEKINGKISEGCDLIVGIGSGVISDLAKYTSYTHSLPYYIVATAPSMDGYASVGAALILGGMKVTENAHVPEAIIADTSVLREAPMDMIIAGYGDIIGKYSCLNDWQLAAIVRDEYICKTVLSETYGAVESTRGAIKGILERCPEAIATLTEALISVGILMAYVGNSRPASGSEHHLSHYFEIVGIERGERYLSHGLDVFYSSLVTAKIREELAELFESEKEILPAEFEGDYGEKIRRIYGRSAEGVLKLQERLGFYSERGKRVAIYSERRKEIARLLRKAPSYREVEEMLYEAGLMPKDFVKLYGEEKIRDGILYSKDLKDRYTVLWAYTDIKR